MKTSITERIFKVIEDNQLSGNQLSIKLGVSRNLISEWKNGKTIPSPKLIFKLLLQFPEVDANWLIRGETIKTNSQNITGDSNYTQQVSGNKNSVINDGLNNNTAQKEIKYLKQIINEKDEQITLLKKLIDK